MIDIEELPRPDLDDRERYAERDGNVNEYEWAKLERWIWHNELREGRTNSYFSNIVRRLIKHARDNNENTTR